MSKFDINNYAWKGPDNLSWKQNYDGMLSTYNKLVAAYHNKQIECLKLQEEIIKLNNTIQEMHKGWNETKKARDDWQLSYNTLLKEKIELAEKYWQAQQLLNILKPRGS